MSFLKKKGNYIMKKTNKKLKRERRITKKDNELMQKFQEQQQLIEEIKPVINRLIKREIILMLSKIFNSKIMSQVNGKSSNNYSDNHNKIISINMDNNDYLKKEERDLLKTIDDDSSNDDLSNIYMNEITKIFDENDSVNKDSIKDYLSHFNNNKRNKIKVDTNCGLDSFTNKPVKKKSTKKN